MAVRSKSVLFSKKVIIIKFNNAINNDDAIVLYPTYQSTTAKIIHRLSYTMFGSGRGVTNASLITLELGSFIFYIKYIFNVRVTKLIVLMTTA